MKGNRGNGIVVFVLALILSVAVAASFSTPAMAGNRQVTMEEAIDLCKQAIAKLEGAHKNKGGHRKQAIERIKSAIAEIKLGIEYADKESKKKKKGLKKK